MVGTAPAARRLLLVEQPGGWNRGGFADLDLDAGARGEVLRRAAARGVKIMLIRRPGRRATDPSDPDRRDDRAWCLVEPDAGSDGNADADAAPTRPRVLWGRWRTPEDLLTALEEGPEPDPVGDPDPDPAVDQLLLVCTHGRKDVCCAVRGRPVAAALAAVHPEQTWECTHTGGDRFAANLLILPDGALYGGLDPEDAVDLVAAHRAGRVDTDHLRGRTGRSRHVQAALAAVLARTGAAWHEVDVLDDRLEEALTAEEVEADGPDLAERDAPVSRHTVLVRSPRQRWSVELTEHLRPAAALTCRASSGSHSRVPRVVAITPTA